MARKAAPKKPVNIPIEEVSHGEPVAEPASVIEPLEATPSAPVAPQPPQQQAPAPESGQSEKPVPGVSEDVMAWVEANPSFRGPEVAYLVESFGGAMLSVDAQGCLQQPFKIGNWTYLMVLDSSFPKPSDDGSCIKIYFVSPTAVEVAAAMGFDGMPFAAEDANGNYHIRFKGFAEELDRYLSGSADALLCEQAVNSAKKLHDDCHAKLAAAESKAAELGRPVITGSKYLDARSSAGEGALNPKCRKVVLSDRALIQIYNETRARFKTETGGLLVGQFEDGVWYVVEASDPGWKAVFQVSYHEADDDYSNHVCSLMSRTYKHPLAFLGMWHRHPGSLDTFSGTDDGTNSKYVDACGNGCISALVNYDPDFRLTFYYVERAADGGVRYSQVDVEIGDDKFEYPDMLKIATPADAEVRIAREQAEAEAERKARRARKRKPAKATVTATPGQSGQGESGKTAPLPAETAHTQASEDKGSSLFNFIFGTKLV